MSLAFHKGIKALFSDSGLMPYGAKCSPVHGNAGLLPYFYLSLVHACLNNLVFMGFSVHKRKKVLPK